MSKLLVKNLSLSAGTFSMENLSLEIPDQQYFVLMGRTGSGKSLLLKAICGLIEIKTGTIELRGRDITNDEPRHREIGYVPQNSSLFPHLDVYDNITFSLKKKKRKLSDEDKNSTDNIIQSIGVKDLLDRSVINLSGGEKQKVAIARALVKKPQLLVLDEPVSALDEQARMEICKVLKNIQTDFKITTIHVCHNRDEANLISDNIGILDNGKISNANDDLKNDSIID